jgi:hypothetical protein
VLSILWLGGLGSVLAVIFGISGHRTVKRSNGWQTGSGLATAGLVIGIVGVVGSVLLYGSAALFVHTVNKALAPQVVSIGTTVNVSSADNPPGVSTVTVDSFDYPVRPAAGQIGVAADKQYAEAKVRVCADANGSQSGPGILYFSVLFPGGDYVGPSLVTTRQPSLWNINGMGADQCVVGFLTFEMAKGSIPTKLQYEPDTFHNYEWTLPSG